MIPKRLEERFWAKVDRAKGLGAANKRKTHCPQGHPLTEENVYIQRAVRKGRPYVGRSCLTCRRNRSI